MVSLNLGLSVLIVISFLIVFFILKRYFWGPICRIIEDREEKISSDLEASRRLKIETELMFHEQAEIVEEARKEAERIVDAARRSAERLKADVIQTAKIQSTVIIEQAKKQVEIERSKVLESIKQDIAGLTVYTTERILGRIMTSEENAEIVNKTINSMIQ
ncbi:MAG: F0F1 ATP synthase subunit B [Spirochaetes bacterium]|nr:F0F1 ATP synthase subunit B [Spirochaetota bacterium]